MISAEYKRKDSSDYFPLVPGFKKSSKSDIVHDYTTTVTPPEEIDETPNVGTDKRMIAGIVIVVFLLIAIIYRILKEYFARPRQRGIFTLVDPPSQNEDSFLHGDYIQLRELNRENRNEAEETESSTSFSFNPQQNEENISLSESYDEQRAKYCPALHGKGESREGVLFPTKSEGIGDESSAGKQMPESSKNIEEKSSEIVNVALSEHAATKATALSKKGSQSSPPSLDPVRKRYPSSEDTPQRPSSWI